jgi:hypothetical protein
MSASTLKLAHIDGTLFDYQIVGEPLVPTPGARFISRIAFAAAHVVVDPLRTHEPLTHPIVDWDATLAYREYLWSLGFGVAEAMDTAQRGMGLDWPLALELIQRSTAAAKASGASIASGAGTDHLQPSPSLTLEDVTAAYFHQCQAIEAAGSPIILMASRALAAVARHPDDYAEVYATVLGQIRQPVILHWLGPMFDPALNGYWGSRDLTQAMENCLSIIAAHANKIDGIKISLLDAEMEIAMRRRLPAGVRMYTGDDFNYDRLILGDANDSSGDDPRASRLASETWVSRTPTAAHTHSDALLGIFDAIAPAASLALTALDAGDIRRYHALLARTIPLSRHIFQSPTQHYKTGVVFLAFLNGFQRHFRMLRGAESSRGIPHLCELFVLADRAGLLRDPALAAARMRSILLTAGVQ